MDQLYVFGTGNATVTRCYNTCFALKNSEGQYFMTDAGGGNGILRILEDMDVDLGQIHHIFITHEHTDHILGLVWLIRMIATRMKKGQYDGCLRIYCHDQLPDTITTICRLTIQDKFFRLIGDRILLIPVQDGETVQILNYPVTFFDIHSTKARQFGFTTVLENGKRFTCCGDEPFNPACESYVKNSCWLTHEAFCLFSQADTFKPYEKHHSTVKDACQLARSLEIKNLILWHTEDKNIRRRQELYLEEGRPFFSGRLLVPEDQTILSLD